MSEIPLYKGHSRIDVMPEGSNTGLWYDKFCNRWQSWKMENRKLDWIMTVTGKPAGNAEEIEIALKRRKNLTNKNSGVDIFLRTDGRFVTGLGRNHPVENGFTWHHTLGTPYIPGTSVKGVVRDHARTLMEKDEIELEDINRIFGPDDRRKDGGTGSVIFLDAIPCSPVQLVADVMTPHYGPYYAGGGAVPGDWHDPTPIPFLVVDDGQDFLFGLIPRKEDSDDDIGKVKEWLMEALVESGAGAKTNVGYGRFIHETEKSGGELWLERCGYDITDIEQIGQIVRKWEEEDENRKREIFNEIRNNILDHHWAKPPGRAIKKAINKLKKYSGEIS